MNSLRSFDIKYLKGVGPKRAELLNKELGIRSAYDLLRHYPNSYLNRSKYYTVRELNDELPMVQVKGRFVSLNVMGEGAKTRLVGLFTDGTATMEVVWFRSIKVIRGNLTLGKDYVLFGKPTSYLGVKQMSHPEVDTPESAAATTQIRGVYPLTEKLRTAGIGARQISGWISTLLKTHSTIRDYMPAEVLADNRLISLNEAVNEIHFPSSNEKLQAARLRLKFDELFMIQVDMLRKSFKRRSASVGHRFTRVGDTFNRFYRECLPFDLTDAQKRVIKEIRADVNTGRQMNRLVQGDVGSGKTLVALMSMLLALDNDFQACLMAPTEILATQHYESISEMLEPLGINVKLLTGSTRRKLREQIDTELRDGSLKILIGTHAVIEDNVVFSNLGLVVIDEQHRFGVAQRARLWSKGDITPHVLVMTATPIPRTLAMTVYGDLDVSVIDQLPPGRKPVETVLRYDEQRLQVYKGVYSQLRLGRQIYIVCPLIEENEKIDLRSLEEGYKIVCDTFKDYRVAYVHGRMKPAEKDYQMSLFASAQADILVATTVIEVGVNVPNASVMIIENAERFGLSQLHQLRGRVGRGADQSYCILMSRRNIAKDTRRRLELMTQTSDGFVIAEADMEMRGPGDIEGTMQSGIAFDLHIANLASDGQIIALARKSAEKLIEADPSLNAPSNTALARELAAARPSVDWSRIS